MEYDKAWKELQTFIETLAAKNENCCIALLPVLQKMADIEQDYSAINY